MIKTGVDIVKIARIENMTTKSRDKFANRILSPAEQVNMPNRVTYLAGRFAAKEAVAKAMGTGIWRHGITFAQIEILSDTTRCPVVNLVGQAKAVFENDGGHYLSISISHDGEYAVAFAIAEYKKL